MKILVIATSPSRSGATRTTLRDAKLAIGRAAEHVGFGAQLCQRRCERIRAAAMCDQVQAFDTRRPADNAYHLQQVLDGVFGRFAVDVVAEQPASCPPAGHVKMPHTKSRPRKWHSSPIVSAALLEAAVVAVHEQHDFLAARDGEPPRNLGLQLPLRLGVRLDDTREHALCHPERQRLHTVWAESDRAPWSARA